MPKQKKQKQLWLGLWVWMGYNACALVHGFKAGWVLRRNELKGVEE